MKIRRLGMLVVGDHDCDNLGSEQSQLDPVKLDLLDKYSQDGWYAALVHGTSMPLWGNLMGVPSGKVRIHAFKYFGVPDTFKIIIVTPDNRLIVSDIIQRQSFQMRLVYDYATGEVRVPSFMGAYLLQFGFPLRRNLADRRHHSAAFWLSVAQQLESFPDHQPDHTNPSDSGHGQRLDPCRPFCGILGFLSHRTGYPDPGFRHAY
jgi:hypothetical protein